jgi:RND family efflux transporter MFP subunit
MPESPQGRATVIAAVVVALAAAAGTAALFIRQRSAEARQVELLRRDLAQGPLVRVVKVELGTAERIVSLAAEVRADERATLYAKVSGYVKKVLVDRGDRVRKGQDLAVLESPDLDAQVAAAQADLTFRKQQLERALRLVSSGRVSLQDREQAEQGVALAEAALARARVQKSYQVLRAPFDGTITARYADAGALLPAATGSTSSAQPLLEIAQLDKLRVGLQLAQDDAARVRLGDPVTLELSPDEPPITARVSRLSRALDARTRTMLCEIDLVHPPAGLYPGAFVTASVVLHGAQRPLVPTDALVGKGGQIYVPTVQGGHVHLRKVRLGLDDGANVEVLEGLDPGELVAVNLATDVADGAAVRVQAEHY